MAAMVLTSLAANAQETYESAQLATEDLNGTARYVGMGGAMEALGADISTMGTNPAGIGLFRRSWAGVSAGVTFQKQGFSNMGTNPIYDKDGITNADINQAGFVYATQVGSQSWFNLGVNFHKSRNFNMVANAVNSLDGASSLNKLSAMRLVQYNELCLLDQMNYNVINNRLSDVTDGVQTVGYSTANMYYGYNENNGYIGEYDINFSGNIYDKVYLGVSLGLKGVHYKKETGYKEYLIDAADMKRGEYVMADDREVTGTGFDIKFGIIFRPVEDSPFRIGAYIHTPTWYDLTCNISMAVDAVYKYDGQDYNEKDSQGREYKYKITTPWKFGISFGHTINNMVALGATYEYADYSFIKNKKVYDYDHSVFERDYGMDANTDDCLRGVSTAKFGVEVKPVPEVAIRIGYNYVSPMYKKNASKDINVSPDPYYGSKGSYLSTYDYINWKDTHRVTFGLGFALTEKLNLDMAYQFSTQKGDYHPFQSISIGEEEEGSNLGTVMSLKNNRHQLNFTLGYRF